jgi:hypothetical protein
MSILSCPRFAIVLAMAITFSITMYGQIVQGTEPGPGKVVGTVTDLNGDPVPHATVTLEKTPQDATGDACTRLWAFLGGLVSTGARLWHRQP